jgi:Putative zinc-finger
MSCSRTEKLILPYVDGRLKVSEQREVEKHLADCATCRLRVTEFRAVSGLLDELPAIEPSGAFDVRVRARVAAEPVKKSWWTWYLPSPRVAFAASALALAIVWFGSRPMNSPNLGQTANIVNPNVINPDDLPVLENYDVISNFEPLADLPPVQADDAEQPES